MSLQWNRISHNRAKIIQLNNDDPIYVCYLNTIQVITDKPTLLTVNILIY